MKNELIVPTGAVHEMLGLKEPIGVKLAPREVGINLRRLNVDVGPAKGKYVDRVQTLRWMEMWNENVGGSEVLSKMIAEFREVLEME